MYLVETRERMSGARASCFASILSLLNSRASTDARIHEDEDALAACTHISGQGGRYRWLHARSTCVPSYTDALTSNSMKTPTNFPTRREAPDQASARKARA
eukprot:6191310-Pleurochrysis_carterae.AAC.1